MGHFGRKPIRLAWLVHRAARPDAELFRPGRADHRGPRGGQAGLLRAGAEGDDAGAGRALDPGRGHRLAGGDLRRVLADPPGDPARLPAAHGDPAHLGDRDRPDLHAAGELDPDGRRSSPWWWASARPTGWPAPTASPSPAPCWSMPRWPLAVAILVWKWKWPLAVAGVRPAGDSRRRLLHRQRAQDPRRRLAAAAGGGRWCSSPSPPGGAAASWSSADLRRGRAAAAASSSSAWSARPTASPAPRCS